MFKLISISALMTFALAGTAFANDGWSGEASLTGGKTTGNTDTEDLALGLKLAKQGEKWGHKFDAFADYGKVNGAKNKQRFALGYQIDRNLDERLYVYGNADYFNDDFGAYEDGYFLGTGLGYKLVLPDPLSWNLEAGAGYRSQNPRGIDAVTLLPLERTNELALRSFSDLDYALNDNVSLYNDTEVIWSDSDTYIWNEVGLSAQLVGGLAARVSYRVDHHSDVPFGAKKTDTAARFGVVYSIK